MCPSRPYYSGSSANTPPSRSFIVGTPALVDGVLAVDKARGKAPFGRAISLSALTMSVGMGTVALINGVLALAKASNAPRMVSLDRFMRSTARMLAAATVAIGKAICPVKAGMRAVLATLDGMPPLRFAESRFLGPMSNAAGFALDRAPGGVFPPVMARNNDRLALSSCSVANGILALAGPVTSSSNKTNNSSVVMRCSCWGVG